MQKTSIKEVLDSFVPIDLGEMDRVRLMDRKDTKYVLSAGRIPDLLTRMDGNYKILEINNTRLFSYLTTYLDTDEYLFFKEHVTGRIERNKVRYRKYEITGKTYLEIKRRTRKNRTIKWRFENELTSGSECNEEAYKFIKGYMPQDPLKLKPVLINCFKRITLVGSEINERVTIDLDLSYSNTAGKQTRYPSIAVIELKRERSTSRSPIQDILKGYYLHSAGFSKYCIGTALLYDLPRKNILKPTLILINKIENDCNRYFST
jgi:hypothetical protein